MDEECRLQMSCEGQKRAPLCHKTNVDREHSLQLSYNEQERTPLCLKTGLDGEHGLLMSYEEQDRAPLLHRQHGLWYVIKRAVKSCMVLESLCRWRHVYKCHIKSRKELAWSTDVKEQKISPLRLRAGLDRELGLIRSYKKHKSAPFVLKKVSYIENMI